MKTDSNFTKLPNDLLEALAGIRIPGEANQILAVILRKTFGFGKSSDSISLTQFALSTGMKKPNCQRAINKLIAMKVIKKDKGITAKYRINKDFSEWLPLSKKKIAIKNDKNRSQIGLLQKKKEIKEIYDDVSVETSSFLSREKIKVTQEEEKTNSSSNGNPEIKRVLAYFIDTVKVKKGFKPIVDSADAKAAKRALRVLGGFEGVRDAINFYLESQKAKEYGFNLTTALSKHSLNRFNEKLQKDRWLYDG